MRSSQAAVDLIVAEEVTSKTVYTKKYQNPEWPGGQSGVTIGIGYDLGFATAARIQSDWGSFLSPAMIRALQSVAGRTAAAARSALPSVRSKVTVPWDAAMHVFENIDMPKWESVVAKAIPGSTDLAPDCFGVLVSIAYNRGASFNKAGDRYREMRNIRAHVLAGEPEKIPDEIRAMKRLWGRAQLGLLRRRDHEALLFEKGLKSAPTEFSSSNRVDTGDDRTSDSFDPVPEVTPQGNTSGSDVLNVQPTTAVYNPEVEVIQRKLRGMNYHEVGDIDGKAGGKFVAGVAAFMTDRGKDPNKGKLTPELRAEIGAAEGEHWTRPIAPERATATAKDLAPKVESVNQTWYAKLWAFVLGVPAMFTAGFKSIFGDYNDPSSYIYSVKSFFGAIPSEYYIAAVAGICVLIFVQAKRAQDATVKAYQKGEIN